MPRGIPPADVSASGSYSNATRRPWSEPLWIASSMPGGPPTRDSRTTWSHSYKRPLPGSSKWAKWWLSKAHGYGTFPDLVNTPWPTRNRARRFSPVIFWSAGLFPLPGSLHLASGQAMWLRNPELTRALEKDLSQARESRRNILHIDAPELERMFFAAEWGAPPVSKTSSQAAAAPSEESPDAEELARKAVARAEAYLLKAEWSPARIQALMDALRGMPWKPDQWTSTPEDPVGQALETLAFESAADLTEARQVLTTAWQALSARPLSGQSLQAKPSQGQRKASQRKPNQPKAHTGQSSSDSQSTSEGPRGEAEARRAAIERFDAARAQGADLETQLAALEADLGLAPDAPALDTEEAPDFPEWFPPWWPSGVGIATAKVCPP